MSRQLVDIRLAIITTSEGLPERIKINEQNSTEHITENICKINTKTLLRLLGGSPAKFINNKKKSDEIRYF